MLGIYNIFSKQALLLRTAIFKLKKKLSLFFSIKHEIEKKLANEFKILIPRKNGADVLAYCAVSQRNFIKNASFTERKCSNCYVTAKSCIIAFLIRILKLLPTLKLSKAKKDQ